MRKVIFQKFIPGVETQEYKDSNDTLKQYSSKLKRFEDGTNCLTEMVHVGYFHGFITGQYGEPVGHIEHEGEMLQLDTSRFKFVDSPEDEQLAEFTKAALACVPARYKNLRDEWENRAPENIASEAVKIAKSAIKELKKQKP